MLRLPQQTVWRLLRKIKRPKYVTLNYNLWQLIGKFDPAAGLAQSGIAGTSQDKEEEEKEKKEDEKTEGDKKIEKSEPMEVDSESKSEESEKKETNSPDGAIAVSTPTPAADGEGTVQPEAKNGGKE